MTDDQTARSAGDAGRLELRKRLGDAALYLLLTRRLCRRDPLEVLEQAIEGGVDVVQVREPGLPTAELVPWLRRVSERTRSRGVLLIVNDDVAAVADGTVDGVHLGQDDMPIADARTRIGPRLLVGWSTHDRAQVERSAHLDVDYIGVGPVFDTSTKGLCGRGLTLIRTAYGAATVPAFAIGGIDPERAVWLRQHGVTRVAVSSAICGADEPRTVARSIRVALGR